MSKINLSDIQMKLYEKLKPSGWGDKLKLFLLSEDFYYILEKLLQESQSDIRFTPTLKQVFRAFEECPYNDLRVVIIGQDPYPKAGVADGISFSCSNDGKIQASLRHIFSEIERTIYDGEVYERNPDLSRWSSQGVLMLNTALTTQTGKIGTHVELWKPFMTFLLDMLASYLSGVVYVFLGNKAKSWAPLVPATNYKLFTTHPASAAYRGGEWNSGDIFNSVNKILKKNNNSYIEW